MFPDFLLIGMHTCLQCSSFSVRSSLLCLHCEQKLFSVACNSFELEREVKGISCLSLFRWQRDKNRILNRLSLALKGPLQEPAWNYYGERFLAEWQKTDFPGTSAAFVPCPTTTGIKDHAYLFAQALSQLTGLPLVEALKRTDVKEQKRMSRVQRQDNIGTKFILNRDISEKFSHIYFVDDIITTGTTVQAAEIHLKKFGHVKAISLIIRE